ncbi:MAG: Trm112 family protein [Myxococcales bacterium]|nr:MAG: Trm112 family protein [Myxococcales bacterium]
MSLDEELLAVIACPKCKGPLKLTSAEDAFDCEQCKLRYPIDNDVPVLFIAEAKPID